MSRQPEDLTLGAGLIRKGEARGLSPSLAEVPSQPPAAIPEPVAPPIDAAPPAARQAPPKPAPVTVEDVPEPPLRAVPPDDVPKRFTSFRLPVPLDEDLRAMIFETRRTKQDLLIEFVTAGIQTWKRDRARRG